MTRVPTIICALLMSAAAIEIYANRNQESGVRNQPKPSRLLTPFTRHPSRSSRQSVRLQADVGVRTLAFVGDGKLLLSLGSNGSQLWDVATGKLLRAYDQFPPR